MSLLRQSADEHKYHMIWHYTRRLTEIVSIIIYSSRARQLQAQTKILARAAKKTQTYIWKRNYRLQPSHPSPWKRNPHRSQLQLKSKCMNLEILKGSQNMKGILLLQQATTKFTSVNCICSSKVYILGTKLQIFNLISISMWIYGSEGWKCIRAKNRCLYTSESK